MICQGCVNGTVYPVLQTAYVPARRCVQCGGPIPEDANPNTRLCSAGCRRERHNEQQRRSHARRRLRDT